jgi:methyl-accepting chemotaxis protein/hemerythrin
VRRLVWSEECSADISLLELLTEFRSAALGGRTGQSVPQALQQINRYAQWQLEREELLLRVRKYPGYLSHKVEHDAYREKVAALQAKLYRRDMPARISNFLAEWWLHHILTADQEYARYFRNDLPTP